MLYPTELQVAVLFDQAVTRLAEVVQAFTEADRAHSGTQYNLIEQRPGSYYALYGDNELMISFEWIDRPADAAVFHPALQSPITRLMFPDAARVIANHDSHILINVQHGAMGGGEVQRMLAEMGMDVPGNGYPSFVRRLDQAARLTSMVLCLPGAQLVHWGQSDQILTPETFKSFATSAIPGPLHIHPFLFDGGQDAQGQDQASILTFGARHFVGREIEVIASAIPWLDNFDLVMAFLRVATIANGYVVPDGDTFGNEDRTLSCRVIHLPLVEGQVPLYRLEPLLNRDRGFQAPDYVPESRRIDPDRPPADLMPNQPADRAELMGEWRAKRAMVEGIGGSLEVKARGNAPIPPPPPMGQNRLGRVFGRKGTG
ncbi:MAG: hypothetical protein ACKOPG_02530 [Novosphingobium sp.]